MQKILVLSMFIIMGCKKASNESPEVLLSRDSTVKLLMDLSLSEAALTSLRGTERDSLENNYRMYIEDTYGMSMKEVDALLLKLNDFPEYNHEVLKEALDSLRAYEKELGRKIK